MRNIIASVLGEVVHLFSRMQEWVRKTKEFKYAPGLKDGQGIKYIQTLGEFRYNIQHLGRKRRCSAGGVTGVTVEVPKMKDELPLVMQDVSGKYIPFYLSIGYVVDEATGEKVGKNYRYIIQVPDKRL